MKKYTRLMVLLSSLFNLSYGMENGGGQPGGQRDPVDPRHALQSLSSATTAKEVAAEMNKAFVPRMQELIRQREERIVTLFSENFSRIEVRMNKTSQALSHLMEFRAQGSTMLSSQPQPQAQVVATQVPQRAFQSTLQQSQVSSSSKEESKKLLCNQLPYKIKELINKINELEMAIKDKDISKIEKFFKDEGPLILGISEDEHKRKKSVAYHAADYGNETVVRYLVEQEHIEVNEKFFGLTLLHRAAKGKSLELVKYLVGEKDASIELKSAYRKTALDYAEKNRNPAGRKIVKYLKELLSIETELLSLVQPDETNQKSKRADKKRKRSEEVPNEEELEVSSEALQLSDIEEVARRSGDTQWPGLQKALELSTK